MILKSGDEIPRPPYNTFFKSIKYIFFSIHTSLILVCFFDIYFYPQITFLQFLSILSWHINNNNCFLTQLEYYFFNETLIDFYNRLRGREVTHSFYVPKYHRYTMYSFFLIRLIYNDPHFRSALSHLYV